MDTIFDHMPRADVAGGPWPILMQRGDIIGMKKADDIAALELLRDGRRTHPRVKRVFDHLGIMV